ncbi:glycosyltransferase family 39 protein [Parasporobacterium paucivorans]|uniref:Dolichyl-phosphate-mannose-protein mannosyltransferase n=1 Tax=Parasporobacterium paucivorans DSM 15970 TaxID=1122934 RepID=A0A1M6CXW5_9FIRM|nr:glycosyltransferase family 39 protein [Parasporobacterium paucivorans]SHI65800.1 Dolichyl-phosphate-mannose-protein mannosyltransferase [Parasporobacterium paucivorans DSM 15970]
MIKEGKLFINISYVIYFIFFGIVCIGTFGFYMVTQPLSLVMGLVMFFLAIAGFIVIKNAKIRCSDKVFIIILIFMMLCMIIIQVFVAWILRMEPSNDRLVILRQALDMINRDSLHTAPRWNHYFLKYTNNQMFLILETGYLYLMNLLGFGKSYLMSLSGWNILCIDSAVILTVLLSKRIWNKRIAMMLAIFCFAFTPFYTYVPFFYTDTLVLPIVAAILYLYHILLQEDRLLSVKSLVITLILGILFATGYMIKATVIILFVALAIHIFYSKHFQKAIVYICIIIVVIAAGVGTANKMVTKMGIFDTADYNTQNFPVTHWIMMGLQGVGKYQESEKIFTTSFATKEEKMDANIEVIKERVKAYGFFGMLKHLAVKSVYTWSNGEYDMDYYLEMNQQEGTWMHTFTDYNGKNHIYVHMYSNGIHICLLLSLFYSGICGFKRKDKGFNWFIKLGILGLFSFLLIWETRPRYLVQYLPLILLASMQGWLFISKKMENRRFGKFILSVMTGRRT